MMNDQEIQEATPVRDLDALPAIEYPLVRAHGIAALATLFISVLFGTLVALKFNFPDFLGGEAWLTWGRLRYNHTQGIFFGWLGNAFLMFCYYAVPRLADRPVLSRRLGWWLFVLWNFVVVLPGWILVLAGVSQPLEWAEFPLVVDVFVVLAFLLMAAQFVFPLLRARLAGLYVSGWYLIGGIIFTMLAYPVGNLVPELVPGAKGAAFSGLWIHDAVGLFVTPFALAIAYFVIPATTRRPIYSHFLSMIGFWVLFFMYPLNGTHHYVYSSIPMNAQKAAIAASAYLGMDVILVVTNLLLSLRGSSGLVGRDLPLRFVWTGVLFYLLVSLQGSFQASMPVNRLTHFTDWVVGHSHLAMLGFATFIAAGGLAHVWQRIPGARCSSRALSWAYWLLLSGLLLMVADLTIAGLIEAHFWQSSLPWLDSVRAVRGYWLTRSLTAVPLAAGFVVLAWALSSGPRNKPAAGEDAATAQGTITNIRAVESIRPSPTVTGARWLTMAYLAAFVAGVGFFGFSFIVLAIVPGQQLARVIARTAPINMLPLTASEARGRRIYGREGCAYCHTEQVRFLEQDVARFGAPTEAWETTMEYPQLWGTRRVGPDLAREGVIRSDDWQLAHLFNPRFIVRDSIMPGFPWLFSGDPTKPTREARNLLAYLKSLGRARGVAGYDPKAANAALEQICQVGSLRGGVSHLNASASLQRRSGPTPRRSQRPSPRAPRPRQCARSTCLCVGPPDRRCHRSCWRPRRRPRHT